MPHAAPIDLPVVPIPEDPVPSSAKGGGIKMVEVCIELTFQDGSQKKVGTDMQRHYHQAERIYYHKRNIMFAKKFILIENTPRSMAMTYGSGTFALLARNRFLTYDRLKILLKTGVATSTHHTVGSLCNLIFFVTL